MTLIGIVISVMPEYSKALSPIEVIDEGMSLSLHPQISVLLLVSIIALQFSRLS